MWLILEWLSRNSFQMQPSYISQNRSLWIYQWCHCSQLIRKLGRQISLWRDFMMLWLQNTLNERCTHFVLPLHIFSKGCSHFLRKIAWGWSRYIMLAFLHFFSASWICIIYWMAQWAHNQLCERININACDGPELHTLSVQRWRAAHNMWQLKWTTKNDA